MALLDKVHQLREIVRRHYLALIARVIGREGLSPEEQASLAGMDFPEETSIIESAYHFGHSEEEELAPTELAAEMPLRELSLAEEEAMRIAQYQAAEHVRAQGERLGQRLGQMLYDGAHADRVQADVLAGISASQSAGGLAAQLRRATADTEKDWHRVAVTELHNARQHARLDKIRKDHGEDARIYKVVAADACPYCVDLHVGPDGVPRIFRLEDLAASNVGRSKSAWEAVFGSTHPNCQCEVRHLPAGWGFDESGMPHHEGAFGLAFEKSLVEREHELQKNLRTKETVEYGGLSIAIEQRKGDVRTWTDRSGRKGQTVMNYAYGYVKGTEGADGDGYDCYVGPVPDAPFVYVVHQQRENEEIFDEDKAMIGFSNVHHAKRAYLAQFDDPSFFGSMSVVPFEEFAEKMTRMTARQADSDGMLKADPERSPSDAFVADGSGIHAPASGMRSEHQSSTSNGKMNRPQLTVSLPGVRAASQEFDKAHATRYSGPTDNPTPPQYPAGPTLSMHEATATAQAGARAVREGSTGPNLLFNSPQPPHSGTHPDARRQQIATHVDERSKHYERLREQRMRRVAGTPAEGLRAQGQVVNPLKGIKPYTVWEERAKIDAEVRDTIPDKREWVEQKLKERNQMKRVSPYRTDEVTVRYHIRPHLLDGVKEDEDRNAPPELGMSDPKPDPKPQSDEGVHRMPKTEIGKKHQTTKKPEPGEKSITVKKRGLGEVTLQWGDAFRVSVPGREEVQFETLSQACDHVWLLAKGYSSTESYRQATGKRRVPSGAGWKFWGLRGQP